MKCSECVCVCGKHECKLLCVKSVCVCVSNWSRWRQSSAARVPGLMGLSKGMKEEDKRRGEKRWKRETDHWAERNIVLLITVRRFLCVYVTVRFKIYGCLRQSSFRGFFRLKKKKFRGTRRQIDHEIWGGGGFMDVYCICKNIENVFISSTLMPQNALRPFTGALSTIPLFRFITNFTSETSSGEKAAM